MPIRHVVARYHEIALKRGNRGHFVRILAQNVQRALRGTCAGRISYGPGRLIMPLPDDAPWPVVRDRLRHVFGLTSFLLCQRSERSLDVMARDIITTLGQRSVGSFAVRTKRADKTYPVGSPEISRIIGRAVQDHTGARVDLEHPELEIHIEMLDREAFFSLEKVSAPGGLPLGSSGTVLTLLSGGIDSPVAAYRIMRRGCRTELVHFHGAPFQSRASQDKVLELLGVLARWQPDMRVHLVPFGALQQEIVSHVRRPVRVVLYRRMMMRIATAIAARVGATALVTGDSLGQVASQTLANLATIEDACTLLILRPLIGMDKQEIVAQAEALGTYAISIQPDEDCCQLFVPRHPATRMSADEAQAAEVGLDVSALVTAALSQVQTVTLPAPRPPSVGARSAV